MDDPRIRGSVSARVERSLSSSKGPDRPSGSPNLQFSTYRRLTLQSVHTGAGTSSLLFSGYRGLTLQNVHTDTGPQPFVQWVPGSDPTKCPHRLWDAQPSVQWVPGTDPPKCPHRLWDHSLLFSGCRGLTLQSVHTDSGTTAFCSVGAGD